MLAPAAEGVPQGVARAWKSATGTTPWQKTGGLDVDDKGMQEEDVGLIENRTWTRMSGIKFNVADVRRPLAAAGQVVEAGNRVVMDPDPEKSYIENVATKEKMKLRKMKGVYVIDVNFEDGEEGAITLDSGAGVSVWPKTWKEEVRMMPKKEGLRMVAANGTEIKNLGQKLVRFQGRECASSASGGTEGRPEGHEQKRGDPEGFRWRS